MENKLNYYSMKEFEVIKLILEQQIQRKKERRDFLVDKSVLWGLEKIELITLNEDIPKEEEQLEFINKQLETPTDA